MYRMMGFSANCCLIFSIVSINASLERFRRPFYCNPGRPQTGKPFRTKEVMRQYAAALIRIMARIRVVRPSLMLLQSTGFGPPGPIT